MNNVVLIDQEAAALAELQRQKDIATWIPHVVEGIPIKDAISEIVELRGLSWLGIHKPLADVGINLSSKKITFNLLEECAKAVYGEDWTKQVRVYKKQRPARDLIYLMPDAAEDLLRSGLVLRRWEKYKEDAVKSYAWDQSHHNPKNKKPFPQTRHPQAKEKAAEIQQP